MINIQLFLSPSPPSSVLPVPPPPSKPLENYYYDYQFPNVGEEFYLIVKRFVSVRV
jgi:hypothetical protein